MFPLLHPVRDAQRPRDDGARGDAREDAKLRVDSSIVRFCSMKGAVRHHRPSIRGQLQAGCATVLRLGPQGIQEILVEFPSVRAFGG